MTALLAILALGFVLGMRHATDPDHVLAVATIVARHRAVRDAAFVGVAWGAGHTLTILVVGGAIVLFSWTVPPRIGLSMEFSVGLMLMLLGTLTLVRVWKQGALGGAGGGRPAVTHAHGDYIHTHHPARTPAAHRHAPERNPLAWLDRHAGRLTAYQAVRPFVVGMVHGLAGSAAVALIVLGAIATPAWSFVYLVVFGAGTIAGMMLVTAAIALPFAFAKTSVPALTRGLGIASGLAALGFGCLLAYRVGFIDGLFTGSPHWTPR
jgi:high-affinity nickel-transport protein